MMKFLSKADGSQLLINKEGMILGMKSTNPIFAPKQHRVMSYARQNRLAKKRRNNKQSK